MQRREPVDPRSYRSSASQLHVLVVDDNAVSLALTERWLTSSGHRVTTRMAAVGTAADVLELRPDVALLEVVMPCLRGDDLARLLKRHPATRHLAIILYSSMPLEELRTLIMTIGVLGVIEKTTNQTLFTVTFNALVAKLRPAIRTPETPASQPAPVTSGTYRVAARDSERLDDPLPNLNSALGRRR